MRKTHFQKAEQKAVDLGEKLAHNPNLRFNEVSVKGAWVWTIPGDTKTVKYLEKNYFFVNPHHKEYYCRAFICLKKRSTAPSIGAINRKYGNIQLTEEVN